jgi:imidazolonepropionase-like amidohydrolase
MHVIRALAASVPGAALFGAPLLGAALITAMSFDAAAADSSAAHDLVIHAGTLLDGVSDAPRRRISILVHDDKIESVQAGWVDPPGAEIVDLSAATVMPGFIDCHVHISALLPSRVNATEYWLTHTDIDRAFDAAQFVRRMLQQGFTAARDVGGGDETVSVRNAIAAGKSAGPRRPAQWHRCGAQPRRMGSRHRGLARPGAPESARASRPRRRPHQAHALRRHRLERRRSAHAAHDQ